MISFISQNNLYLLALLILVFIGAIFRFYQHCFGYWKRQGLQHLKPVVPFGNATDVYLQKCSFGELFMNWYLELKQRGLKHGGAYFFGKPVYIPTDAEIIKKILISDFIHFPNHGLYIDEQGDPLSAHIFNMENYKWRTMRAKMPAAFTSAKLRKMFLIMEKMSKELKEILDNYALSGTSVDIKDVLSCFTTDIISACGFGMQSNTMKNENPLLMKYGRVFFDNQWSRLNNTIVFLIPRWILKKLKFRIITKEATNFFMDMFKDVQLIKSQQVTKRNDIAELLIELCNKDNEILQHDFEGKGKMEPLTFEELAAQMYIFFEAGFETSSSTQTFALYELAANQDYQKILREEINRVLEKHDNKISYDAIMEMQYLDRVVDETLRKYPIFPIIPRACVKDYQIPGTDVIIEKDTFVMVTNMGVQRDPEYWPNPDKFDPDRFTSENKANRPSCAYIPFGDGPRVCIGKRFGLLQTKLGIITIIKNFETTISKKMKLPFQFAKSGIMLKAEGDVWLDLKKI